MTQRAFVIGNGPSLNITNLDKMAGEIAFGCNNLHLLYDETTFRPSHYVRAEGPVLFGPEDFQESVDIHEGLGCEMWMNYHFGKEGKYNLIHSCAHNVKHFDSPECPHMLHLPMLCTFGSSVNVAVQIAMLKKYSPIYLVGCDLGYQDGKPSHFDPNYENGHEQPARYANLDTLSAHMIASRSGWPIYNATKGGFLEAYPRVDYDVLF